LWGDPALANFNGMVWYRKSFTLTAEQAAKPAILDIGWADDLDQTWVNGTPVGNTNGPGSSRAYVIPAGLLKAGENNVTVNVLDTYSGGGLIGPEELRALRFGDGGKVPLTSGWTYRMVPPSVGWPPRAPWEAIAGLSTIYNAMIAPMGRYGLRGIAWNQGESDASTERGYARKLGSLMRDWRSQFGNPDLAFLVVQLANWGPPTRTPQESGSATIRDEQRLAVAADPHAGLAVTIDLGEPNDIHPANKQDVGHRLARAARKVAYEEPITAGPQPVAARRSGDAVTVELREVEGELVTLNSATAIGFELCGEAGQGCRFVDAKVQGSTATLATGGVPAARVRFCWGDSPVCNLYDRAGLPVGPFELQVR
jgi:sialate O-acetylesterase